SAWRPVGRGSGLSGLQARLWSRELLNLDTIATTCPVNRGAGSVIIPPGRGGLGIDVVIRVEQDHCLGAYGDDYRNGVGNPRGTAGGAKGAGKACLCRARR